MPIFDKLIRGFPGHPIHAPLTDATIGMYTLAAAVGVIGALGGAEDVMAQGMWLALVGGLIVSAPTALTGLVDWLSITRGTPLFRTATFHLIAMVSATLFFAFATWQQHGSYEDGTVSGAALVLTLVGFALLTLGGWLGGSIVFVHGMRVLKLLDEPARSAMTPGGERKEDAAAS